MAPNIKDVARIAGMSTASVSIVLNDKYKGQISEDNRKRILEAVKKLGYTPHRYGRALKLQKSEIAGYAMAFSMQYIFSDPYFHETIVTMEKKLREYSYSLLFFALTPQEGNKHILQMNGQGSLLDGIIIEAPPEKDTFIAELEQKKIPVVIIGNHPDGAGLCSVDVDNVEAGVKATEHLIGLGRKSIGFISGPLAFGNAQDRLSGYRKALIDRDMPVMPGLVQEGDFSIESGYEAMKKILDQGGCKADGIVAGNDLMAIGAMNLIKDRGLKIPEDIAVVGFNNTSLSQHYEPALTTVNIPAKEIAQKAVEMLIAVMKGNGDCAATDRKRIVIDTELIIRESTRK